VNAVGLDDLVIDDGQVYPVGASLARLKATGGVVRATNWARTPRARIRTGSYFPGKRKTLSELHGKL